ncbi:MAG TPA: hypothetical protein VIG06_15375, partial [Kofleriaceae bacterium]
MAISIRRGFALVGGLVALLEVISIAVLITVALNGRDETVQAIDEMKRGDRDLVAAWKADAESELDYKIIEGLAIAEVAVLLLGGGVTIWMLHRNV